MSAPIADPGIDRFIEFVRSIPPLDREEEQALAWAAAEGDVPARERLVLANLRHVVSLALKYRRDGIRLADLVAEGNLGLMVAAQKFDPSRGTRFVTYASYWIRAFMLDLIIRSSSMVSNGSGPFRSKLFFRLRRERARLSNLTSDETTRNALLAAELNMSEKEVEQMLHCLDSKDLPLDAPLSPDGKHVVMDVLEAQEADLESAMVRAEMQKIARERIHKALNRLDERERFIVEQRFLSEKAASLASIGRKMGLSRERVRQLEARAKEKLRKELTGLKSECSHASKASKSKERTDCFSPDL
ncbi:MAG: sigma-70 family RNA polymerase sigma factor [Sandaracinaceae bacterium]|nr:sigma-70 family RNA polymerase sigma factor [Sandaracinaceae bacterium]MDW8246817.1 sigma-70 family RNA polymerase sigma factor [Sandaracinaceae bacterium]